jgi:hypothetical protein
MKDSLLMSSFNYRANDRMLPVLQFASTDSEALSRHDHDAFVHETSLRNHLCAVP